MSELRSLPVYEADAVEVPFVISGMDEQVHRDTRWEEHSHPTHELLWNEHGASTISVGSRTWTITPTLGLWIPAGVLHSGSAPAGTWYRAAQFGVRTAPPLAAEPVAVEITPLLGLLLDRLTRERLGEASRALTEAMVLDVLAPSARGLLVQVPASALLAPIVEAVLEDPADPRSLGDWAAELGTSTRTLTRAFRAETGLGFQRWASTVRTQRAMALLARGIGLDEVAERVGYRSVSAFGAAFRRTTGLTPGVFRDA